MAVEKKTRKKKTTFRKIENGMILEAEDGNAIAVGYPVEVETLTAGKGKGKISIVGVGVEGEGTKYSKVTYNWDILSSSALSENEKKRLDNEIASTSGTIMAGSSVYVRSNSFVSTEDISAKSVRCTKCGHMNQESNLFCSQCGNALKD